MTPEDIEYMKDPKTAVREGLGSALADIWSNREFGDLPELNLTDTEEAHIVNEITYYILSRYNLQWKEQDFERRLPRAPWQERKCKQCGDLLMSAFTDLCYGCNQKLTR